MISEWHFLTPEQTYLHKQDEMAKDLGISPILSKLLLQRNITTIDEAKRFFRPQLSELHDPFLMLDMDKAVARLNLAMGRKEKILIYGDYDVDGTTAVTVVYKFLRNFYSNIDFYIPDRSDEGYGISYKGIDFAYENDFKLIIVLDCGIKAIEKIDYANRKGVDFIICDHHKPDDELPDACAILDPKRPNDNYPFKHLSAAGVGFKFMQGFAQNNGMDMSLLFQLLDLVAVSIAADIVSVTGENRILAFYGLKILNNNPCIGLKSIIDMCGMADKEITLSDVVFKIGPRLNASGRMQSGGESVELLIAKDMTIAQEKCEGINLQNEIRKGLDKTITEEAFAEIDKWEGLENRRSIVIYNEFWHKGVIGIVASRLTELYYKPAVVLTLSNGLATGSARSIQGVDIYKAIDHCRDLLENFGGHPFASGLSMKEENVQAFSDRFEEYVAANITDDQLVPQLDVDAQINFSDISPKFFRVLKQFAPFGPDNPKPVFCTRRVYDYGTSRLVGKDQEHLKLELIDSNSENIMNGIAFGMYEHNDLIKNLNPFDICYTIEENNYGGNVSIQLLIKDIKAENLPNPS
ncbi:MAG: single-stranded-DNA-specific exonuclease RecJ [Bacteroidales bacterium]|nr:single-stranded-DNA-specific exonuclease RecJ [Bacteroidales bacterium]